MTDIRQDLGNRSDIAAIAALLPLAGLRIADVGCGPGDIARALADAGATVLAAEPDPIQAAKNRVAPPIANVTFVEAPAEKLPIDDGSLDAVFFFRSLHHVPVAHMDAALAEAARVLKPDGALCIVEPGMTGTHFPVMRPFHDETHVRTAAQAALARTALRLFRSETHFGYTMTPRYPDFEAMVARVTGQTFNNISRDRVETDEVRALFEAGRTPTGDYAFDQPMLLNLYQGPLSVKG
jgi:hypothetical protein